MFSILYDLYADLCAKFHRRIIARLKRALSTSYRRHRNDKKIHETLFPHDSKITIITRVPSVK